MNEEQTNLENQQPEPELPAGQEPEQKPKPTEDGSRWHRLINWYKTDKKKSIPLTVLILLVLLAGIPWTRFMVAGLVLKKDFSLRVVDSTAHTPVSGATVRLGSTTAVTDANGKASLHGVKVGSHNVSIDKKYYQDKKTSVLVPILRQEDTPSVSLSATGRQVRIVVTNLINKQGLAGVKIEVAGIEAKTDKSGNALIVLPVGTMSQKATLSLEGYNEANVTIEVGDTSIVKENKFNLTPTGRVYFLSKRTGKLDLMKADLDGSDAKVVVAGTGNEEDYNTFLLQSGDSKYVALLAKRSASDPTPQLYVLAADDDKLLAADSGNADFQLYGWVGDSLVYTTQRRDLQRWQQGLSKLKAYEASSGKITLLDSSAGSAAEINANEYYTEVALAGNAVVYGKVWQGTGDLSGKQSSLHMIEAGGQNHKAVGSYDAADSLYFSRHAATGFYIWQHKSSPAGDKYYEYTVGSSVREVSLTNEQFYQGQFTYFFSPSAGKTFWAEARDGKNTLLVGDASGNGAKTVASSSDYDAYGWYSDQYLLVSKKNSQLYIMDPRGGTPIKITDYHATAFEGI